jgi:hypothetical protein
MYGCRQDLGFAGFFIPIRTGRMETLLKKSELIKQLHSFAKLQGRNVEPGNLLQQPSALIIGLWSVKYFMSKEIRTLPRQEH